eukprot:gnl/TRDRNA2_/TRDRNA2_136632_c0_seq2.p1 gnl/TRDRNA2_/TRDRNA2_136632_c0~~gnl/TRDRNA2_/TRDRNA2_136632_c0_seq2.p1  ORF type:complete len:219 (+),score=29.77 gnl/TRDRNA2_/TRDRNA2_136632_c0_seq2:465-1121(+)
MYTAGIEPICAQASAEAPVDILLFGLGGGAVHTHAKARCPSETRIESVEADPRIAAIAVKYFGVPAQDGDSVVDVDDASSAAASLATSLNAASTPNSASDGSTGSRSKLRAQRLSSGDLPAMGKRQWDVVVTDCFVDKGVTPESCRSREFITYLRLLARPGGKVLQHIWFTSPFDESVAPSFHDTVQLYKDIFGDDKVSVQQVPRASNQWDAVIVVKA